jgi:hypothetical protein
MMVMMGKVEYDSRQWSWHDSHDHHHESDDTHPQAPRKWPNEENENRNMKLMSNDAMGDGASQ